MRQILRYFVAKVRNFAICAFIVIFGILWLFMALYGTFCHFIVGFCNFGLLHCFVESSLLSLFTHYTSDHIKASSEAFFVVVENIILLWLITKSLWTQIGSIILWPNFCFDDIYYSSGFFSFSSPTTFFSSFIKKKSCVSLTRVTKTLAAWQRCCAEILAVWWILRKFSP